MSDPGPRRGVPATLLRLWTLRSVDASAPSARGTLLLLLTWLALWLAFDYWDALPDPEWWLDGVPLFAWYALGLLSLAALLRWCSRPRPDLRATLLLAAGLLPVPVTLSFLGYFLAGWPMLGADLAALGYVLLYLLRGSRSVTGQPQRLGALAGAAFVALFVLASDALDVIPGLWQVRQIEEPALSTDHSLADEEALLFGQPAKIDRLLAGMRTEAGAQRAFFLGFAGVGGEKVFTQEIGLASRIIGDRYGTSQRSLKLINDERNLDDEPLASISALRYALRGLGARMNPERDVLFLAISSHGSAEPSIAVENSELPLNDLSDTALKQALDESGIKWRVIIISACYAGGFIEALKDAHSIIITAAAADRTSFGCGTDSDLTYFGEAFYRDALPQARSLRDAFEHAKSAIGLRERRERVEASHPQAFFGAEIEARLKSMEGSKP